VSDKSSTDRALANPNAVAEVVIWKLTNFMDGVQTRNSPDTASGRLIDNFPADFRPTRV
jgi:hypothetical protein